MPAVRPNPKKRNGRRDDPTNIWLAKAGFGGTVISREVLSEGSKVHVYNHRRLSFLS